MLLALIPHLSIYSPRPICVVIDNSQSMRRYAKEDLLSIASSHAHTTYTFGNSVRVNSNLTFDESESVIDWDMIDKDTLCIVVTDGYIQERGRRPENVLPVRLTTLNAEDEMFLHDLHMSSHSSAGNPVPFSLSLSSLSDKLLSAEISIKNRNNQLYMKSISVQPDVIFTLSDSFIITETGLQEIIIEVKYNKTTLRHIGYVRVETGKTEIVLIGQLSPEITYMRRYFDEHPLYDVHTLLRIGDRYLYDNAFITSVPTIPQTTIVISTGMPLPNISPDIVFYTAGVLRKSSLTIKDLLQDPIPIDGVRLFPTTPDRIYHRAGVYPVVFTSGATIYVAIADFHTYYMRTYHIYDAVMRRVLDIYQHDFNKEHTWYLQSPIVYRNEEIVVSSSAKTAVYANQMLLQPNISENGFEYRGYIPEVSDVIVQVANERHRLYTNTRLEPLKKNPNIELLSTFADGVLLTAEKEYGVITNKLQRKRFIFSHYPYIAAIILTFLCLVWWSEHRK